MASATGNLNGSGPHQAYVWLSYHSMNQAGNYTTWYWEAVFKNNGGLNWIMDGNTWQLSGFAVSGPNSFAIPSSWVGTNDHALGSGTFNKGHNADGYLSAGNLTLTINTSHSAIGDGSASVSSGTPPRVPKAPSQPPAPTFVSASSDSLQWSIVGPSDNGGSTITTYEHQILEEISGPTDVVQQYTSPASNQDRSGLEPGTKYRLRYRARNAIGNGPWSPTTMVETLVGVYVSNGSAWVAGGVKVSTGSAWVNLVPEVSTGSAWVEPT